MVSNFLLIIFYLCILQNDSKLQAKIFEENIVILISAEYFGEKCSEDFTIFHVHVSWKDAVIIDYGISDLKNHWTKRDPEDDFRTSHNPLQM